MEAVAAAASLSSPYERRIAELEAALAAAKGELDDARGTIERLRRAYTHALEQLQLLRRRLFLAKAERADVGGAQLAFDSMFQEVQRLGKALDAAEGTSESGGEDGPPKDKKKRAPGGQGRRNLSESNLPIIRVELTSPELEETAERIGVEESSRLGYERGGMRHIILVRAVYKAKATAVVGDGGDGHDAASEGAESGGATTSEGDSATRSGHVFVTTPLPKELIRRAFLAPSMIAHLLVTKYMLGVPFYRLEQQMRLQGAPLDRGTMCRYAEDVGATLGVLVDAMRKDAFEHAFCLSTDATGVSIQLGPIAERKEPKRGACRKGHFFVVLADKDHVFFEYQPKHTSAAVSEMFRGFPRYIQADAHAVYDALFGGRPARGAPGDAASFEPPLEVGCWSHARRNFWEAAVCKHAVGVEGLRRINLLFAADEALKGLAPAQRKARRDVVLRPLVDAFFAWAKAEHARPRERGLVATALGYVLNQEGALRRFLDDGRLRLDNNASERALRPIAAARSAWLFFGSDDHASAAANLFSLIASCKLHGLDPEPYLADVMRVMPYWPRERYLELVPKHWATTRARLSKDEMKLPLGLVTVPPPLPPEEQRASG